MILEDQQNRTGYNSGKETYMKISFGKTASYWLLQWSNYTNERWKFLVTLYMIIIFNY